MRKHFEALTESQQREHAETRAAFIYMKGDKRKARVQLGLLESLRFRMMNDRYDKLARAHEKTFEGIFKDPRTQQKPWDNFVEWLETSTGIYWIQGKAASGKSTLMRFIWNRPQTLEYLLNWAQGERLITAAFFFWNSGIEDQRSQSGLLRALLYEVLKNHRDLIPDILPDQWEESSAMVAHDLPISVEQWTLGQLKPAFERLIKTASPKSKLCFFIDGLDEYDGDPEDIAQFFLDLSGLSPYAKFCISSRPWPVFQDIYEGVPGLKLQDLTHDDIALFVNDKLGNSKQMKQILQTDAKGVNRLFEELIEKAAGVFLWVVLVVKSLLKGLCNGDTISHLRRRLASLPSDLEDLYGHMLRRIDPMDREEATQMFQIFHTSGHSLDIPTLERALRYSSYQEVLDLPTRKTMLTEAEIASVEMSINRMTVRLNSRSKGLLEVVNTEDSNSRQTARMPAPMNLLETEAVDPITIADMWFSSWAASHRPCMDPKPTARKKAPDVNPFSRSPIKFEVEQIVDSGSSDMLGDAYNDSNSGFLQISYLHRTVRDYLEQKVVWNNLLAYTRESDFDPKTALLLADVVKLKTTERTLNSISIYDGGLEAVEKIRRLVPLNSGEQIILLQEIVHVIGIHWVRETTRTKIQQSSSSRKRPSQNGHQNWQAKIPVIMSLAMWYICTKIEATAIPSGYIPSPTLLAYALGLRFWCDTNAISRSKPVPDYGIVESLLCHGCNPNAPYYEYSIWEYVISFNHIRNDMEVTRQSNFRDLGSWIGLCRLLLEHGADPNASCINACHQWWIQAQNRRRDQPINCPVFDPNELVGKKSSERWNAVDKSNKNPCSVIHKNIVEGFRI